MKKDMRDLGRDGFTGSYPKNNTGGVIANNDDVNTGALLRIADACEVMVGASKAAMSAIQSELASARRREAVLRRENSMLKQRLAAQGED